MTLIWEQQACTGWPAGVLASWTGGEAKKSATNKIINKGERRARESAIKMCACVCVCVSLCVCVSVCMCIYMHGIRD